MSDIKARALARVHALIAKVTASIGPDDKASEEGRTFAVVVVKIIVKHNLLFYLPTIDELLADLPSTPGMQEAERALASLSPEEFEKVFDVTMREAKRRVSAKQEEGR